jgi:hypothetical protein
MQEISTGELSGAARDRMLTTPFTVIRRLDASSIISLIRCEPDWHSGSKELPINWSELIPNLNSNFLLTSWTVWGCLASTMILATLISSIASANVIPGFWQ